VDEPIQDAWRARILACPGGPPRGAGVLLPGDRVLTCAHVVERAVGLGPGDHPDGAEVTVDLPGSRSGVRLSAAVVPGGWAPPVEGHGDVAVLRLLSPLPGDARPAVLRRCGETRERRVRVFGQPDERTPPAWARAVLAGPGGPSPDWIQLDGLSSFGARVRGGYSGAGVVTGDGAVIGIVVAEARPAEQRTAWMLPAEAVLRHCPLLGDALAPDEPPGRAEGWPPGAEQRLTHALVRIPSVRDPQRRRSIVDDTGQDIALLAERSAVLIEDVRSLVRQCLLYADGVDRLAAAVRWYENGSLPMADFERLLAELRPEGV
jgi:hypothetical protein